MAKLKGAPKRVSKKTDTNLRNSDKTPVSFKKGAISKQEFPIHTRGGSKYAALIDAALELDTNECLSIPVGDSDPDKAKTNIAMIVMNKINKNLEDGYKAKARLNRDRDMVVISMHEVATTED